MTCLVLWCKNRGKIPGVNYFCMTKKRHDTWMRALGRDPTVERLSEKNVVCSQHFPEENIQREGKRISLRPNAVPTLYLRRRCQQWKNVLGFVGDHRYADLTPEQSHNRIKICSLHFRVNDIVKSRIRCYAVPSLRLPHRSSQIGGNAIASTSKTLIYRDAQVQTDQVSQRDEFSQWSVKLPSGTPRNIESLEKITASTSEQALVETEITLDDVFKFLDRNYPEQYCKLLKSQLSSMNKAPKRSSSQPSSTSNSERSLKLEPQDISQVQVKIEPDSLIVKNEPLHEDAEVDYNTITLPLLEFLPEPAVEVGEIGTTFDISPSSGKAFCRLCLKPTNDEGMVYLTTLDVNYHNKSDINGVEDAEKFSKMIKTLMPSFNFGLVYNPKMCHLCSSRLELAFKFVEEAMESQKRIEAFKEQYSRNEQIVLSDGVIKYQSKLSDPSPPIKKRKLSKSTKKSSSHHQEFCEVQSSQRESALNSLGDYLATTEELTDIVKVESFCPLEDEVKIEIDSLDVEGDSFNQMEMASCAGGDFRIFKSEPEEADNHRDSCNVSSRFNLTNDQKTDVSVDGILVTDVKEECLSSPPTGTIRDVKKS